MKKKNSGKELLQKLGTLMALALLVLIFCVMMPISSRGSAIS